ncbi:SGNH/GDSL hydrolase family protein [Gayadomonas joobiniege]|uniref:SGNH/GDSL hydrolase family protein n=1 Tax=Gayadomonas joobiniege TaxID=1234606 RepID=UPI000375E98E|nr:SGNH/GDSL hydrolase family protein [Gayadomonas joobiniege]
MTKFAFLFIVQLLVINISNLLYANPMSKNNSDLAHNNELYEGPAFQKAFNNPVDHPDRPNVLLIGDSISIGYTVPTRKLLAGKVDVFRVPSNGKHSEFGAKNLKKWLGDRHWDLVHFNWGLWDICYRHPESKNQGHRDKINGKLTTTPEQYKANLKQIIKILKNNTQAKLIWANTTPVPDHELGRIKGDEIHYNNIAQQLMLKNKISINDLHQHASKKQAQIQKAKGDVHFTPAGYQYLAEQVAFSIEQAIEAD